LDIRELVVELLWKGGWYKDALDTARETFNTRKDLLGSRHRDNMKSLNMYVKALLYQGRYREADPLIQQAFYEINTFRSWYQPSAYTTEYLTCLDNYAFMLRYKGEFTQAVDRSEQAWTEGKKKLDPENRHTLGCLANLALAYQTCGSYGEALRHSRQALRALESQQTFLGGDDLDTLASRDRYATALYHQGLYVGAEQEIERAWDGRATSLGDTHPDTLSSLQNHAVSSEPRAIPECPRKD
jgi:tetratricopeptide (TPR) repeat protein